MCAIVEGSGQTELLFRLVQAFAAQICDKKQNLVSIRTFIGKCFKISMTFLVLFSNKMMIIRAGIKKFLVRIANREDPDQTASSEAV